MKVKGIAAVVLALATLSLCVATVAGQIPDKMSYQVRLTDDADQALVNETLNVSFRIHNIATGGPILWQENQSVTTDDDGIVSVVLGAINPLNIDFDVPLWLEIRIEDEILAPRRELLSAPYAMYAQSTGSVDHTATAGNADSLGGVAAADYTTDAELLLFGADYVPRVEVTPPGTINDTLNVVDWTRLKGVPADFADGVDDGGTADGHSLDADDGDPVDVVYVDGDGWVHVGNDSLDGMIELYRDGSIGKIFSVGDYSDAGGAIDLFDDAGAVHTQLQPDLDGGAGFVNVEGPGGNGVVVDGNDNGDGSPNVLITGTGSTVEFDVGTSGDASVLLPNDSVGSAEILDEPGVAGYYAASQGQVLVTYNPMISHSIVVPGPGYVFAMATGQANCTHDSTAVSRLYFGISADSTVIQDGLDQEIRLPDGLPSAAYSFPIAPAAVFEVASAGTYTYYLPASADGTWYLYDTAISLLYFPTAYGTVTGPGPYRVPAAASDEDAVSAPSSVEFRRAASEAANDDRIQRELADMEARIAEIRAEMDDANTR